MNVLSEITIAMETQHATTMMVHLVAHAILASLEMEPIAKVCLNAQNYFSESLYNIKHA